ncbi:MAG: trigger factor, partial [Bacteroidales bacterium]|nr:trigger factor [Bacteroidales bacterium]
MEITKTNKDELNAVISLKISAEDYAPAVEKELKSYQKTAQIKGFRPGKAPMGLIKKLAGNQIVMQELDKMVSDKLTQYLIDEKLDILGQPLPSDDQQPVDIINEKEHEFLFDIGLAPEINFEINEKIQIPYYKIKIDDALIDEEIKRHQNQFATAEQSEKVEANSYLKGNVTQTDKTGKPVEEGIFSEDTLIAVDVIKDEKEKEKFLGAKLNDVVVFDIKKAFPNNTEIAGILKIDSAEVDALEPDFNFLISEITSYTPAKINQELFDKVYGKDTVKNEEEYREKIKENIAKVYADESKYRFAVDAKEILTETAAVKLPDEFLKKWLKVTDREGKLNDEILEKEYPVFSKDTQWQLLKGEIAKTEDIKISEEEIREESKRFTEAQFIQYGLPLSSISDEHMQSFIDKNLEKQEDRNKFAEKAMENKVFDSVKEKVKIQEKEIS